MSRIITEHYGENIPLFSNESEDGRALNRKRLKLIY